MQTPVSDQKPQRHRDTEFSKGLCVSVPLWPRLFVIAAVVILASIIGKPAPVGASDPGSGDWPMWGGTPDRNMVSSMKGLPTEWDVKTKKNGKWIAERGSPGYRHPGLAG